MRRGCMGWAAAAASGLRLGEHAVAASPSQDGWTALLLAVRYGHESTALLLLDRGAYMEASSKVGARVQSGAAATHAHCAKGRRRALRAATMGRWD